MNTTGWYAALEADVQLTVKNSDHKCVFVKNALYFIEPFNNVGKIHSKGNLFRIIKVMPYCLTRDLPGDALVLLG